MTFLSQSPFHLDAAAIAKVHALYEGMTREERVTQLFVLLLLGEDPEDLEMVLRFKPGGVCRFFSEDLEHERKVMTAIEDALPVRPLITADLEGSRQSLFFGTAVPNQLGLSAIDDPEATRTIASITAREAKAMGVRWSFTPVVDINAAFRSAVVGTRSYGSDVERIERHALAHIQGLQDAGMAATVKHWPGEGYDDRDQHLVTTTNPLDLEQWDASFGRLYRSAIDAGVLSVMSAHIAFPAFVRAHFPDAGEEAFRPASINRLLNTTLLREKLGFNGVIVSDATEMGGLCAYMAEPEVMPEILISGCDVILFSRHPERDRDAILKAMDEGRLTEERVRDACLRTLALKAKLGLLGETSIVPAPEDQLGDLARPEDEVTADAIWQRAPSLVKDTQGLLPLSPAKHKRVLLFESPIIHPLFPEPPAWSLPGLLEEEGFEITRHERGMEVSREKFDLAIYLLGDEALFTRNRIFIDWGKLHGGGIFNTLHRFWKDLPCLMLSFGHAYHLYDAPRVPTYVNAWSTHDKAQAAVLECLLGRSEWQGGHPVDPFCGLEDARY